MIVVPIKGFENGEVKGGQGLITANRNFTPDFLLAFERDFEQEKRILNRQHKSAPFMALDSGLEFRAWVERDHTARIDREFNAGLWVATRALRLVA